MNSSNELVQSENFGCCSRFESDELRANGADLTSKSPTSKVRSFCNKWCETWKDSDKKGSKYKIYNFWHKRMYWPRCWRICSQILRIIFSAYQCDKFREIAAFSTDYFTASLFHSIYHDFIIFSVHIPNCCIGLKAISYLCRVNIK